MIKQFWYISHLVDYQVVDAILWYKYIIMKVELLRLDSVSKSHPYPRVSRRFELIYTLQGIKPNNMTHVSHEGTMSGHSLQHDQRVGSGSTSP
jgi:hypothetical protein